MNISAEVEFPGEGVTREERQALCHVFDKDSVVLDAPDCFNDADVIQE